MPPHPGLTPRLRRHVLRTFGVGFDDALAILEAAADHAGTPPDERCATAIVQAAQGDLAKLGRMADLLAVDFRDVLVAGGLANVDWPYRIEELLGPAEVT